MKLSKFGSHKKRSVVQLKQGTTLLLGCPSPEEQLHLRYIFAAIFLATGFARCKSVLGLVVFEDAFSFDHVAREDTPTRCV